MNNTIDNSYYQKIFERVDKAKRINIVQDHILSQEVLNKTIKNHQQSTWKISNTSTSYKDLDLLAWMGLTEKNDIIPNYVEDRIAFNIIQEQDNLKKNNNGSVKEYKKDFEINFNELGKLLYSSFGRNKDNLSKRYPSAGALYPVIPLLIVMDNSAVPFLKSNGCYVFDSTNYELLLIKSFDEIDIKKIKENIYYPTDLPKLAIGYSIDIKRAITKYKNRGYRHALIEVGLMAQSFRESIWELENYGECCWSGFSDNAISYLFGLSPRIAPVALLQWFGEKNDI
jgi:SagB-type dehydrogenase family enzyme